MRVPPRKRCVPFALRRPGFPGALAVFKEAQKMELFLHKQHQVHLVGRIDLIGS